MRNRSHSTRFLRWFWGLSFSLLTLFSVGLVYSAMLILPFSAVFDGHLVDVEFRWPKADVTVAGNVTAEGFGNGTFAADGQLDLIVKTGAGTVTMTLEDGSTLTMNLVGKATGESTFDGSYRITGGTGQFAGVTGGSGSLVGTFNLTDLTFEGSAQGQIKF
ncbi:hypothetical protein HYR99_13185 [Candidatus Poribacteria bacterium]|nr:hypothetical protein [Candidatus Poribacteria bacterium]